MTIDPLLLSLLLVFQMVFAALFCEVLNFVCGNVRRFQVRRSMTTALPLLLKLLLVVSQPYHTVSAVTRLEVRAVAHNALRSNGAPLATRTPRRATPGSTFARFLRGSSIQPGCDASPAPGSIFPGDFGGDPTGKSDSSHAFDAAIKALLARNSSGHHTGGGWSDLGGAHIDLRGGDFQISRPIVFPHGYGNFGIRGGTLRAGPLFPSSLSGAQRFLIEVSDLSVNACKQVDKKQKSCNENVDIVDLLLDGSRIAYGGIQINATMGANVGPDIYIVNWIGAGLSVNGGHEVMLHQAWLGATYYGQ